MKKKFTFMMAALMLLVFMTSSLAGWGQTRSVTYEPATSISAGDVVLLVAEGTNYKKELSGFTTSSTIYGTVADFTTAPAGVYPLTVVAGNSSGSFAFKNSENKYLSWSSGNSLQLSETLNNSSSWTFDYSHTVTTLTNVGTTARQIKYNSSSPRFACYTSGQQSIKLYKQVNSSLVDCDLALTGAPVALSFDLYNNASAQTVNFTTSSTGAITVSQSDYITATVNANNKTITVSPVAVTNSTQTITVSQAADDTYDAGQVTFTVEVTDSTPTTTVTIDDSGITNTDVYVSTEAGSLSATVTSGDSPVSGATVTWSGDNDDVATIASDGTVTLVGVGTVTFTATYAGASGQYAGSSATYEMTVTSSAPYVQPTTIEIIPNYTFWGKTGQFSGSTFDELDGSQDNVFLNWTRGSGSTYANSTAMRFYKDNELTFTAPEGYEITSIVLAVSGTYNDLTFSPTGYDNTATTWTGSSATVTMSRPSNASSYAQISKFTITLASSGSAVATTTTINVPANFNTDIYQGTTAGTLTATVTPEGGSALENPTITWSSSDTNVATIDANGAVTLVAVGTTTITASYAGVEDEYKPSEGTYELTVTNSNAPGTQNNPYTVAQARAAIDAGTGTQGVYATGIVSAIPTAWDTQHNNITFNFVDNAGDNNFLQAYRCVSGTGVDASTVAVGDIVVVHGNLTKYNSTYEFGQGCELVSLTHPTYPIIIADNINLTYDAIEGSIAYTISNPTSATLTASSDAGWISNITVGAESVTFTTTANEGDADRSATITLSYTGADDKVITVTQAHYVPDYATLPFVWEGGASAGFAALNGVTLSGNGSDYNSNHAPYLIKLDGTGDYIQVKTDSQPGTVTIGVKMIGGADTSTITVQGSADGETFTDIEVLTISGKQNDVLNLETTNAFADNVRYVRMVFTKGSNVGVGPIRIAKQISGEVSYEDLTISENETYIVSNGGILTVTGTLTNTNPDNLIIEDGGQLITSKSVKATFKKTTTASTEAKVATNNWYAISSPVNEIAISSFAKGTHNVYSYDEPTHYWHEYNSSLGEIAAFDHLANGRGYLYRSTEANIEFAGDVNIANATYTLSYTDAAGNLAGFHLIGNPFTHNIYKGENGAIESEYLEGGFYTLSAAGAWIAGTDNSTAIVPGQAILVQAKAIVGTGVDLTITKKTTGGPVRYENDRIMFTVKNAEYSDIAYALFKEGHGLNKIDHRNAEIPMLYVISEGENYAIADMPDNTDVINLGFEAKTMGQYTISLKAEGQYSYMHLVDKLTGNDIDMLVEDSYTFVGTPNDRNDRFVLRLNYNAAGIDTESDIFAYQSGNEIIVNGEGTLEVFDVTGRKVMATTINGVQTVNGLNNGFYIFRLNEKTQKIVVR